MRPFDHEFAAHRLPGGVEDLTAQVIARRCGIAAPDDDKAATGQAGDIRNRLRLRRGRVDQELAALAGAIRAIALAVDAIGKCGILVIAFPDDDITAIRQGRDRGFRLCRAVGRVHLALCGGKAGRLVLRGHVQRDDDGRGPAAVAVGQLQPEFARGMRIVGLVRIGQIRQHGFDRRRSCLRVEADRQPAIGQRQRADGHAAKGDRGPGHPDLAGACSLVAQAQHVLCQPVRGRKAVVVGPVEDADDFQPPAREVCAVRIDDRHAPIGIQQDGRRVHIGFGHDAVQAQAPDHRVCLRPAIGAGPADHHLADAIGGTVKIVAEGDHDIAIRQPCQRDVIVVPARRRGDRHLAVDAVAVGIVALRPDLGRVEPGAGAFPGNQIPAARQADHRRFDLGANGAFVDQELVAHGRSVCCKALSEDAVARTVGTIVRPDHDKATAVECSNRGLVLRARRRRVHHLRTGHRDARGRHHPRQDALARGIPGRVRPGKGKVAIGQQRHLHLVQRPGAVRAHDEFRARRGARSVEPSRGDLVFRRAIVIGRPADHKAAIRQRDDMRRAFGECVRPGDGREFGACGLALCIEDLHPDLPVGQ